MASALVEMNSPTVRGASTPTQSANSGFTSLQEEIAYYKSQYEQLEVELQEFQASSRELEAELEKDVEASEKRERNLKEKVDGLRYEVDEWKAKYKQSKAEANTAQNNLQKEITSLRDTNRTLTLKLRDIEVVNDDFERQARNTTSSLEDMESKFNVALERGVMLEEEIKVGEQEREALRIETQRLREDLSDLKVEAEITQEKLRAAESLNNRRRAMRNSQYNNSHFQGPRSPLSDKSTATSISTPPAPPSDAGSTALMSDTHTPPSPPLSETSGPLKRDGAPIRHPVKRPSMARVGDDPNVTPRPSAFRSQHTRGGSVTGVTPSFSSRKTTRPMGVSTDAVPRSGSLYQIRGLIGKMQKLEERVHSVKSKLPAPTNTPPRASPRGTARATPTPVSSTTSSISGVVPSSVTVRSTKKRGGSTSIVNAASGSATEEDMSARRLSHRQSRISFGASTGANGIPAPGASGSSTSRPSSRAGNQPPVANGYQFARPSSRASTAMGSNSNRPNSKAEQYRPGSAAEARRPRSSLGGATGTVTFATLTNPSHSHTSPRKQPRHSQSHAILSPFSPDKAAPLEREADMTTSTMMSTPTPRRTTLDKSAFGSSIPAPTGTLKRQASSIAVAANRRSLGYSTPTVSHNKYGSVGGGGSGSKTRSGAASGSGSGGGGGAPTGDVGETY